MATGNMHRKAGKVWTIGFWDMRADRQTDSSQYSTLLPSCRVSPAFCRPLGGGGWVGLATELTVIRRVTRSDAGRRWIRYQWQPSPCQPTTTTSQRLIPCENETYNEHHKWRWQAAQMPNSTAAYSFLVTRKLVTSS